MGLPQMEKMVMVVIIVSMSQSAVAAMAISFQYLNINTSSIGDLYIRDPVSVTDEGMFLTRSTTGSNISYSAGRAFYNQSIPLWRKMPNNSHLQASFNTSFAAQFRNTSGQRFGDGVAFIMAKSSSPPPPKSAGGYLALYNDTTNNHSFAQLIAVEFDSFLNPEYNDPDGNHVGIDINSINSTCTASLYSAGINLTNGPANFTCWVEYDGLSQNLSVYATKELITNSTTRPPSTPLVLSYTVDLSHFLPENIYVGLSAATGNNTEIHRIISWAFNSTFLPPLPPLPGEGMMPLAKIVVIVVGSIILLFLILFLIWYLSRRRRRRLQRKRKQQVFGEIDLSNYAGPRSFTYKELSHATRKFSRENLLGRGGFGTVYKGILHKTQIPIAVKCIEKISNQSEKEFLAEVTIISRIRHKNLLPLKGWCLTNAKGPQKFLVYEYMPNSSLDKYLYSSASEQAENLDWSSRYKIVGGLAAALVYLHEDWEKQVIHRDVKPSNILLDGDFNPRLGDFGLARQVDHHMPSATTRVAGTLGFLAPEVLETGKATAASDVFSFGVVVLEVTCGRQSLKYSGAPSEIRLVDWVWNLHSEGRIIDAVDPRLKSEIPNIEREISIEGNELEEMVRVLQWGLACSHPDPFSRPTMRQVHESLVKSPSLPHIPSSKPLLTASDDSTTFTCEPSATKDGSQLSLSSSLFFSSASTSSH